jgi:hypothetical protein
LEISLKNARFPQASTATFFLPVEETEEEPTTAATTPVQIYAVSGER